MGIGPGNGTSPYNTAATQATAFTASAAGNIDNDAACDVWRMNDAKTLTNSTPDV
jgi:hypothetical protein